MDSAYDAPQIRGCSQQGGHGPILDPNRRRGAAVPLDPAEARRFCERRAAERVNRRLKERWGGRWVRVRGARNVMAHLRFGLMGLTASALYPMVL